MYILKVLGFALLILSHWLVGLNNILFVIRHVYYSTEYQVQDLTVSKRLYYKSSPATSKIIQ